MLRNWFERTDPYTLWYNNLLSTSMQYDLPFAQAFCDSFWPRIELFLVGPLLSLGNLNLKRKGPISKIGNHHRSNILSSTQAYLLSCNLRLNPTGKMQQDCMSRLNEICGRQRAWHNIQVMEGVVNILVLLTRDVV